MGLCVQQRVGSERLDLGAADSNVVSGGCKQGDVVFYQETQKGGAGTLIAQISGLLVDRARARRVCLLPRCTGVGSLITEQAQTSDLVYQVSL